MTGDVHMATPPHGIPTCASFEEAYQLGLNHPTPVADQRQLTEDSAQVTCGACIAKLASAVELAHLPQGPPRCKACDGVGLRRGTANPAKRNHCGMCNGTGHDIE